MRNSTKRTLREFDRKSEQNFKNQLIKMMMSKKEGK
jgi:hypothetical protein